MSEIPLETPVLVCTSRVAGGWCTVLNCPAHGERNRRAALDDLRQRDKRVNAWLEGVRPGDIVTVRLNSTDTLTGRVYEAPDARGTSLCVWTTVLRHGNGCPGASYEPVLGDGDEHGKVTCQ